MIFLLIMDMVTSGVVTTLGNQWLPLSDGKTSMHLVSLAIHKEQITVVILQVLQEVFGLLQVPSTLFVSVVIGGHAQKLIVVVVWVESYSIAMIILKRLQKIKDEVFLSDA